MTFGILAAVIAGLGTLALLFLPARWHWIAVSLILIILTPITLVGFWPNGQWGISDWDYYFSYHTAVYRLVVEHGVFPQWNPYICGGTSAIGDPEFPLFAPTFLLELLFGVPLGLRLAVFYITAFGALGMILLARRLGLSPPGALVAALAFSFGSINLLEIVEGHPNVFSAYYLPWIFWSWFNAYSASTKNQPLRTKLMWPLACAVFLALTFFQGGIYMLMYVTFAFIFLIIALPHRLQALKVTIIAGLWALGFAAIKLVPVLMWLRLFQDKAYASSTSFLLSLHEILLGRHLHGSENIIPNQGSGWHEYGAYIGIIVFLLALASLLTIRQKQVRLLWGGALIAILIASSGPLLKPLFDAAPFLPRSNISRLMIMAILPLSLLSGVGLVRILPRRRWGIAIAALIIAAAAFDLTSYAATLSKQAFILTPYPAVSPPPAPVAYTINQHVTRVHGVDYARAYAGAEAGYGTMAYCSVLGPTPAVRVVEDPEGSPYLTVPHNRGQAELLSWTPAEIRTRVTLQEPGEVTVNANYAKGWRVNGEPARESSGRLTSMMLPAGTHEVTFRYHALGLWRGVTITALTILATILYLIFLLYSKVRQARA